MAYYKVCPDCGASLDPGEPCDCGTERAQREAFFDRHMKRDAGTGQMTFRFEGEDGDYAAETDG